MRVLLDGRPEELSPRPLLRPLLRSSVQRPSADQASTAFPLSLSPGAGRGLFVTSDFKANPFAPPPPLIAIPTSALLNAHTLKPHYPKDYFPPLWAKARKLDTEAEAVKPLLPLTSNQLVTLHLALHHPESTLAGHDTLPSDPWAPYLRSLPRSFHWHHPLTWLIKLSDEDGNGEGAAGDRLRDIEASLESLFACLPKRAQALVRDVERRFQADAEILRSLLVRRQRGSRCSLALLTTSSPSAQATSPPFPSCPTPPLRSFLWAWLNINTRCLTLHLGLGPADGSNDFTLSPIVDFANHSPSATPVPITLPEEASTRKAKQYALHATEDMVASHTRGRKTEVLLQYGPHDDAFLLAEYGFVCWKDADGNGNRWNEARVDDLVEAMLMALPGGQGHAKKRILEDEGYWR